MNRFESAPYDWIRFETTKTCETTINLHGNNKIFNTALKIDGTSDTKIHEWGETARTRWATDNDNTRGQRQSIIHQREVAIQAQLTQSWILSRKNRFA